MRSRILVLATRNKHKIEEMSSIIIDLDVIVKPVFDIVPSFNVIEDGDTFVANSLKKAKEAFSLTGLPSLADDSGLEVDALGGRPGVHSSRFGGEEGNSELNNALLLEMLADYPTANRTARFKTVMAFVTETDEITVEGICEGFILEKPQGKQGFGYDPLFYFPEAGKSFAEMTQWEKNKVSHRGKALKEISPLLRSFF